MNTISQNTRSKRKERGEARFQELSWTRKVRRKVVEKKEDIKNIFDRMPPLCHCVICFLDMGECNPRQYCEKTFCPFSNHEPIELALIRVTNLKASSMRYDLNYKMAIKKIIKFFDVYFEGTEEFR